MIRRLSNIAVVVSLLVVVASVAGQLVDFHVEWNGWTCYAFHGHYALYQTSRMVPSPDRPGVDWTQLAIPFGFLFLLLVVGHPMSRWWPKVQPDNTRRCQQCSYDLTGNTSGVCPECGTPIPRKPEAVA